jgi:hypothetical protein
MDLLLWGHILFFTFILWSVGDVFDQNFYVFMGLSRSHCFIRLCRSLMVRVQNVILSLEALPYFPLFHSRCFFLDPCQANGLCGRGGCVFHLDHVFRLWNPFLMPLSLPCNPDILAWCTELWWIHSLSNSHA